MTKIKENLENFLTQCDNNIKISQKIKKGTEKFNKEEKNILKILSYISKISDVKKEFENLFKTKIEGLNFFYDEEKSNIIYKKYYFNDISFKVEKAFENSPNFSFNFSWKKINVENIDNNNIRYIVEMKKENNEKFEKIYEGNKELCSTENLIPNTYYEFRMCYIYNDIQSEYTNIQKVKTPNIDFNICSKILYESKRYDKFLKKLLEWTGSNKMQLIYRGTRDGMTSKNFRDKCVNQGITLTLIKNEKDNIFGGYASIPWENKNIWSNAPDSFIFTLTNIYNIEPTKFYSRKNGQELGNYSYHGPNFGFTDIYFCNNFNEEGNSYSKFPNSYEDILRKGNSIFSGDSKNNRINLKEIEVFKLFK